MSTSPTAPGGAHGAGQARPSTAPGERAYHRALVSLWLFAASFLLSLIAFISIWAALGYTAIWGSAGFPPEADAPSGWTSRGIWLLLTLVYAWPELVVVRYAREAARLGRTDWKIPVVAGGILAGLMPLLNAGLLVG